MMNIKLTAILNKGTIFGHDETSLEMTKAVIPDQQQHGSADGNRKKVRQNTPNIPEGLPNNPPQAETDIAQKWTYVYARLFEIH